MSDYLKSIDILLILLYTACPNKNLTIFARKICGYKWKFLNKFGLH